MINPQFNLRILIYPVKNSDDKFALAECQVVRLQSMAGLDVGNMHRVSFPRLQLAMLIRIQSPYHLRYRNHDSLRLVNLFYSTAGCYCLNRLVGVFGYYLVIQTAVIKLRSDPSRWYAPRT